MKKLVLLLLVPIGLTLGLTSCKGAEGTLIFDANGGVFSQNRTTISYADKSGTKLDESVIAGLNAEISNGDKVFTGWYENKVATGSPVKNFSIPYHLEYSIYAGWKSEVILTLETYGLGQLENIKGYEGKSLALPELNGETFELLGWYEDEQFLTKFDQDVFPSSSKTLYAKFEEYPTITLHYPDQTTKKHTAKAGATIEATFLPPTKDGYVFSGWYQEATFENVFYFSHMPGSSLNLYPKFIKSVKIIFSSAGGTLLPSLEGLAGQEIQKDIPVALKENHTLEGWYLDPTFTTGKFDFKVFPEDTITLYAKWNEYPRIIFQNENGDELVASWQLASGVLLEPLPILDIADQEFLGWYQTLADGSTKIFDERFMPSTSLILTARFVAKRVVTIHEIVKTSEIGNKVVYLDKAIDIISGDWWKEAYQKPEGYDIFGLFSKSSCQEVDRINLPHNPAGDIDIYVKLAQHVKVSFYDGMDLKTSFTGGEGMEMNEKAIENAISKVGYSIEGYYTDQNFSTSFSPKFFPMLSSGEVEIKVYIKYILLD